MKDHPDRAQGESVKPGSERRIEARNRPSDSEERLIRMSYFDTVTGTYNRQLFVAVLGEAVNRSRAGGGSLAVVDLDIDRFRMINEAFGQPFGDQVLRTVAQRLAGCLASEDILARIASDEFAIILRGNAGADGAGPLNGPVGDGPVGDGPVGDGPVGDGPVGDGPVGDGPVGDGLDARIAALLATVQGPITVETERIGLSVSHGAARYPADSEAAEDLLELAGARLARVKARRMRHVDTRDGGGRAATRARLQLEGRLRDALEYGALGIHIQPQVNLDSGALCGAEALVRWTDPELGPVPPDRFVPLAEECGLIGALGEQVLHSVIDAVCAWQRVVPSPVPVGVNLSALQFAGFALDSLVSGLLERHGIDPAWIKLELTETALLDNADHTRSVMERLCGQGLRFSLDDFGTGYSSLSHLHSFPIDEIKIDRSFVARLSDGGAHARIIRAVVNLAHDLDKTVVAEGVETAAQRERLREFGCDSAQGYLFDPPLPPARFAERWLDAPPAASG